MSKDQAILLEEQFAQKRMSKEMLLRLAQHVRPYRRKFILNLVFTLLATASSLLGPKLIQIGIDRHLTNFASAQTAARASSSSACIYLANLLVGWFLSITQVKSAIAIGQGAMNDLRLAVFKHIQRLSLNYFDKTHQGRILSRADNDISALDNVFTWGANQLLSSTLTSSGPRSFLVSTTGSSAWPSARVCRFSPSARACFTFTSFALIED